MRRIDHFSHQDARNLLRYGGMRSDRGWLQFDCALSHGLVEYMRTLKVQRGLSAFGPVPFGEALRTGDSGSPADIGTRGAAFAVMVEGCAR